MVGKQENFTGVNFTNILQATNTIKRYKDSFLYFRLGLHESASNGRQIVKSSKTGFDELKDNFPLQNYFYHG